MDGNFSDNMRVAVVFDEKTKKPTVALQRLSSFYKYEWRFCNARAGWEKGNVERSVDFVRGRAFTTNVDFDTVETAQEWLDGICRTLNAEVGSGATDGKEDRVREEMENLRGYPGEIGCYELSFDVRAQSQNDVAQLSMTIYCNRSLMQTISLKGSDRSWRSVTVDLGMIWQPNFYLKWFFSMGGIEVQNAVVRRTKTEKEM